MITPETRDSGLFDEDTKPIRDPPQQLRKRYSRRSYIVIFRFPTVDVKCLDEIFPAVPAVAGAKSST